ncbi:phosphotransacetylase family protein (plasmid) [Halobaculum sp. CBA1158]|uniref:phosphotransacetylase family protein n=1 Tax=Halobaculum sp. CBA1158 TaxID=2904243 RepID=UPI001F2EB017|nr:phosphotransacetylase family protein [Halobaculum sp. CBA1158]UIP01430.1 phosphotransacetylase family protein [Halobaculum sp. CBA1158]
MNPLLVTSTAESTGKTAVTLALARIAADRGRAVGYMKPKGTRLQSVVGKTLDEDPMLARELLGLDAEMHEMEPIVYSPTFVEGAIRGREDPEELRERIAEAYDGLAADTDAMFVEGGGDYRTGGVVDLTDPDVAEVLDAEVLLVADYEDSGDVDDLLAAVDDVGDRLAGVLFNRVDDAVYDAVDQDVIPYLSNRGVDALGALPRVPELAGVTVSGLADELGAEVLVEGDGDALVQRFTVGAMGAEEALRHFRRARDAAVITGGDRSDIATAAIEATSVRCLVLTGGHRPSGSVLGKATEAGLPVLSVPSDTLTTVDRAEDVIRSGRTRDERTVEVMRDLLETHADVAALLGSDGN